MSFGRMERNGVSEKGKRDTVWLTERWKDGKNEKNEKTKRTKRIEETPNLCDTRKKEKRINVDDVSPFS